jgi:hypothetical protein
MRGKIKEFKVKVRCSTKVTTVFEGLMSSARKLQQN